MCLLPYNAPLGGACFNTEIMTIQIDYLELKIFIKLDECLKDTG